MPYGGKRAVYGFNNLVDGPTAGEAGDARKTKAVALAAKRGFRSSPVTHGAEPTASATQSRRTPRMATISRNEYVGLFGPTIGDRIRLGDTGLFVEIERDLRGASGDEIVFGGGKSLRDGMGMDNRLTRAGGAPDLVITNVTIIDAVQGVVKADVGIRDGRICAIGKAGNPQTMDGVTPGLECGLATDAISGDAPHPDRGRHRHAHPLHLAAAGVRGAVERHDDADRRRHRSDRRIERDDGHAGHLATSAMMLRAFEGWPVNVGILGKGHGHGKAALVEQIDAGAVGFKCHEDWGTTPAVLRSALTVADEMDVQVCMHTDTLNESGFVEDTIAAFEGRTIHSFHTEGSGGGHAPDIIKVAGAAQRAAVRRPIPRFPTASTRRPSCYDMIMVCHHLQPRHSVGRGVRREPHPRRDDRRRERAARSRRDLDVLERLAGDGPRRRVLAARDPDGRRDEDGPRQAARGRAGQRQFPRAALRRQDHDQSRRSRTASRTCWARSRSARWPTSCCGSRRSSAPSPSSCSRAA